MAVQISVTCSLLTMSRKKYAIFSVLSWVSKNSLRLLKSEAYYYYIIAHYNYSFFVRADLDPIYYCELLKACEIKDDGDATITNLTVTPTQVVKGNQTFLCF